MHMMLSRWFVLACGLVACGQQPGGVIDGGLRGDAPEAADAPPSDAAVADAAIDAPPDAPPDGPPTGTPVTVTFSFPGVTPAGNDVLFLRAEGSLVAAAVTDDAGRAQGMLDEPGMVVVHFRPGNGSQHAVYLYTAVPPGSHIFFGTEPIRSAVMTVEGPAYPGATQYRARACGVTASSPTTTIVLNLEFCDHAQTHILWTAVVGTEELTAFAPAFDVVDGTVELGDLTFRPQADHTISVNGIPESSRSVDLLYRLVTSYGNLIDQGAEYLLTPTSGAISVVDRRMDLVDEPTVYATFWVSVYRAQPHGGSQQIYAWIDHTATPTLDLEGKLTPWVSSPTLDTQTRTVQWEEDGHGTASATLAYVFALPGYWAVVAPHGPTQVTLPRLPAPYEYLNIEPTTQASADVYLLAHPAGYARYLADFHGTLFGAENAPGETSIYTYDF
jgi:hypothetical protein